MNPHQSDWHWLDARDTVSAIELCRACGLSADELDELMDFGALAPVEGATQARVFSAQDIVLLRAVGKLRADFDLDAFTMALLLGYLARIEALERQVSSLQAYLPGHLRTAHAVTVDVARGGMTEAG